MDSTETKPDPDNHDHCKDWNPMKDMAESLMNTSGAYGGLEGLIRVEDKETLCPFNDGSGRCFKKDCRFKHVPYTKEVLRRLPKLENALTSKQEESNTVATSLPPQFLPANGCITKVAVVAAFDPWNFYVIPENGWKCLCSAHEKSKKNDGDKKIAAGLNWKQDFNFFQALENIQSSLKIHFSANLANHRSDFNCGEVVAVRMSSTNEGRKAWYRAKIMEDVTVMNEDEGLKAVDVKLKLLDYGIECIASSVDVAVLPEQFCLKCPLAYKCQLFGVSPILGTWSSAAIKIFKELVADRCVIAEVSRTAIPDLYNNGNDINTDACFLNLYAKTDSDDYVDVAEKLFSEGLGLEWNVPRAFLFK